MKDYVSIYYDNGRYFIVNEDTVILHYLLDYKITKNKIVFKDLSKVVSTLDKFHINYTFNNKLYKYDDNHYFNIYSNGNNHFKLNYKARRLRKRINNLDIKNKMLLLNKIEEFLDEG